VNFALVQVVPFFPVCVCVRAFQWGVDRYLGRRPHASNTYIVQYSRVTTKHARLNNARKLTPAMERPSTGPGGPHHRPLSDLQFEAAVFHLQPHTHRSKTLVTKKKPTRSKWTPHAPLCS